MRIQFCFCFLLFVLISTLTFSQEDNEFITNPSFEDTPRKGSTYRNVIVDKKNDIKGWTDCGKMNFEKESAPDIHSQSEEFWSVKMKPSEGETFLGLVVRDNNTWEEVSQELNQTLRKGQCYSFTIDLAKADPYLSPSRMQRSNREFNFSRAVILRIWGGLSECDNLEMLYKSPPINNKEWQTYEIMLQPKTDFKHISIQAYYLNDVVPYNGNILVDNISKITKVACNQ